MRTWKIANIEFRTDDNVIVIAHWRCGATQYASQDIASANLVAGVADEAAVIAAVKAALGEDKVAAIETAAVTSETTQLMPSIRSTSLANAAAAVAAAADDKDDRAALVGKSIEAMEALIAARRALEVARATRDSAKAARDAAVAARDAAVADVTAKTTARDQALAARDAGVAAGTTGAPMQALRDALTAATAARADAVTKRDAASADAATKNTALDAATAALATARTNLATARTAT